MPLLDLVPPALALVLHHRRLFDKDARRRPAGREQIQQRMRRSSHRRKKLPAGKDRRLARARRNVRLQLHRLFAAFERRPGEPAARQPRIDRAQHLLRHRNLGQRQQQRFIQRSCCALRLRIELADRLDLVAEEVDAHRALHLRASTRRGCRRAIVTCPGISTTSTRV